jgi:hypothetical protein
LAAGALGRAGGCPGWGTKELTWAGAWAALAFFTERIALAAGAVVGAAPPPELRTSTSRMREASSSLIELLWLRAAMDNFSAASSTSLLSRPKSRDNS